MNNYTFNKELLSMYHFDGESFFNQCYVNMCKANLVLSEGLELITNQVYLNGCELSGYIRLKVVSNTGRETIATAKIISPVSADILITNVYKESLYASNGVIKIDTTKYNVNDIMMIKWSSFLP